MTQTLYHLQVDSQRQCADLYQGKTLVKTYKVSTSAKGLGCVEGSNCTPTGKLRVSEKIGSGEPVGTVFRSRIPSGALWESIPENPLFFSNEDLILTRVLWLEGCAPTNSNTKERYIYLHGTNQEKLLGTPVSHGCIRFSNQDILELFDLLQVGSEVEIA